MQNKPIPSDSEQFGDLVSGLLRDGTCVQFVAHGQSMRPFIHDRDVVKVDPVTVNSLRCGDIALCRHTNGQMLIHRVISIHPDKGKVLLQGDAAIAHTESIASEDVLGRVSTVKRNGKTIDVTRSWRGLLGRIWGPCRLQRILTRIISTRQNKTLH